MKTLPFTCSNSDIPNEYQASSTALPQSSYYNGSGEGSVIDPNYTFGNFGTQTNILKSFKDLMVDDHQSAIGNSEVNGSSNCKGLSVNSNDSSISEIQEMGGELDEVSSTVSSLPQEDTETDVKEGGDSVEDLDEIFTNECDLSGEGNEISTMDNADQVEQSTISVASTIASLNTDLQDSITSNSLDKSNDTDTNVVENEKETSDKSSPEVISKIEQSVTLTPVNNVKSFHVKNTPYEDIKSPCLLKKPITHLEVSTVINKSAEDITKSPLSPLHTGKKFPVKPECKPYDDSTTVDSNDSWSPYKSFKSADFPVIVKQSPGGKSSLTFCCGGDEEGEANSPTSPVPRVNVS